MFNSLRNRLITFYLAVVILGFGGLTLWSSNQIMASTITDFGNSLQIQALSVGGRLGEAMEYNPQGAAGILQETADNVGGEATLFNRSGQLQDSTSQTPLALVQTDSFVLQQDGSRTSQIIASAPVGEEGEINGYIQINVPRSIPAATARQRLLALWAVFATFSLLGISATYWLITSVTRPLEDLQQTALTMAGGDLSQRVADPSPDEIGDVGRAFNTMAEQVENIVADQRAFASNASHELRTPLTTIRLRTEMMLHDDLNEETKSEFVEEIDSEVKRMSGLVDDLLLLSRIDAKRLSAGTEQIDGVRLIQQLTAKLQPKAAGKNITLSLDSALGQCPITANLNHAETVFRNVVENGIKYTPEGGRVSINLTQTKEKFQVAVTDTGEGITAEDLPNIGKRFFRADRAHSRKVAGTGLGLALVVSILELYDGTLDVKSDGKGKGATFEVSWPL